MSALLSLECPPEGTAETYLYGAPRTPACWEAFTSGAAVEKEVI